MAGFEVAAGFGVAAGAEAAAFFLADEAGVGVEALGLLPRPLALAGRGLTGGGVRPAHKDTTHALSLAFPLVLLDFLRVFACASACASHASKRTRNSGSNPLSGSDLPEEACPAAPSMPKSPPFFWPGLLPLLLGWSSLAFSGLDCAARTSQDGAATTSFSPEGLIHS